MSNTNLRVRFDGIYAIVEGDCPLCDWTQEHTHLKDRLHQHAQERAAARRDHPSDQTVKTPIAMPRTPTPTQPSTQVSRYVPPMAPASSTAPSTTSTAPKTTTPVKKKEINVYRIRTTSDQMSVDKTVTGARRKIAVAAARNSHSRQLDIPLDDVSIVFARFIGKYEIPEPPKWSSNRMIGGWVDDDGDWSAYGQHMYF